MGQEITTDQFSAEHFERFRGHLQSEMELLREWFRGRKFCEDDLQAGLELEAWLIGRDGYPVPDNSLFLTTLDRKWVVPELSKFNFEVNVQPQYLSAGGLGTMQAEFGATWSRCREVAEQLNHRIVSIGILPTVTSEMLCLENMSPLQRYAALNKQVLKLRGGSPLDLSIDGADSLRSTHRSLMLESAATSIQIHLKVPLARAARYYNAALIASAITVALAANAPLLFGKRLWADTRIPLFEQAVDTAGRQPRVSFGQHYVQESLLELFENNLANHRVLLPAEIEEAPAFMPYVRMHNGTVWNWNRPLIGFETDGRPHLRIEHRPMSASPTVADLFADVAFWIGLTIHLGESSQPPERMLSFQQAKCNFYSGAKSGLHARLIWLDGKEYAVSDLLEDSLIERALETLAAHSANGEQLTAAGHTLAARVESRQNGAAWQLRKFEEYRGDVTRVLLEYARNQAGGQPVHSWS